jgi:hypothetical protein
MSRLLGPRTSAFGERTPPCTSIRQEATVTTDRRTRPWAALVVAVAAVLAAVTLVVVTTPADEAAEEHATMLAVAPGGTIELSELPDEHVVLYEAARADVETFSQVPCYCGCEDFLGHRHLLDCFVTPDGDWERHATGCGVCLGEAQDVLADQAAGRPLAEILDRIDAKYGAIVVPTT